MVTEKQSLAHIMGHEDYGFAQPLLKSGELILQIGAGDGVESAEGFVHQENGGIGGQRSGYTDPLTLSTGKFARVARGELRVKADE
jgi:hypothetical protein